MTWPVVCNLRRDLPGDLGDPVLNTWIIGRNAQKLEAALTEGPRALRGFWDARIFHPEPLTLAYSEHLLAQTLQALPVYVVSKNPILCYNLLFLSTFFLSAFFCFQLVREWTGSDLAAWMAGLLHGFAPVRIEEIAHVQTLSSQWMPLCLLALGRYFDHRRRRALAVAAAALLLHNLSCGYLLFFFAPFLLLYALYEIGRRDLWRNTRVWLELGTAGAAVLLLTLPFLLPYRELRQIGGIARPLAEIEHFSADLASYRVAPALLRILGPVLRGDGRPMAALYPSAVAVGLALLAIVVSLRQAWRETPRLTDDDTRVGRLATWGALLSGSVVLLALASRIPTVWSRIPDALTFGIAPAVVAFTAFALAAPRLRRFARRWALAPPLFWVLAAGLALWLSLGPRVRLMGRPLDMPALYSLFYAYVPGFDGLRATARFAMLLALFLAVLGGHGAAVLARTRAGRFGLAGLCALFLAEVSAAPLPLNGRGRIDPPPLADPELKPPPAELRLGRDMAPVYDAVRDLPADSVILELPFGARAYEVQYELYSLHHHQRLVNGWSGWEPPSYVARLVLSAHPWRLGETGWDIVLASGATHALVHEGAWRSDRGVKATAWLEENGARRVFSDGGDVLLALPNAVRPSQR